MADIQLLYLAFFNRPADPVGLAFWNQAILAGADTQAVARQFEASAEHKAQYDGKTISS
jgi:hypothetical protein